MKNAGAVATIERQSTGEEIANSVTHGIGTLLSIAALVLLLSFSAQQKDAWRTTSFSIYGGTLIFLYLISTLYHSFPGHSLKRLFRKFDHAAIFLLIAGTYTPVTLILMRDTWQGWVLFSLVWLMTVLGITFKFFFIGRLKILSVVFYLVMGWLAVFAFKPLAHAAPLGFMLWLILGGVCYSLSVVFYSWRKLPYHHMIFHLFILAGSFAHFFGLLQYLT